MKNNRFVIYKVQTYYQAMKDLVDVQIQYYDNNDPGHIKGVLASVQPAGFTEWDEEVTFMRLAEKAAMHVGDSQFIYAMRDWYMDQKVKVSGKNFYDKYSGIKYEKNMVPKYDPPPWVKDDKITPIKYHSGGIVHKDHVHAAIDFNGNLIANKIPSKPAEVTGPSMKDVDALPGLSEIVVHPVTKGQAKLQNVIINLNDEYHWSREKVADWLDTLDLDLRFLSPDAKLKEKRKKELQKSIIALTAKIKDAAAAMKKMQDELTAFELELITLEETP